MGINNMNYRDYCLKVNFNPDIYTPPKKEYTYFSYKHGVCKEFKTSEEAKSFSMLNDYIVANQEEIDEYIEKRITLEEKAVELWSKNLRETYKHLTDDIYNHCYNKSYEDNHSAGYDEIANGMINIVESIEKLLSILNKEQFIDPYLQTR